MAEVRQFCREVWGKNWWDVAEDVKEARKRVASSALGGEPADDATATLAGDVEVARAATKQAAANAAAASAAKAKRVAAEAEAEKRFEKARVLEWAEGGAVGVANAAAARLVAHVQQAHDGSIASIHSSEGDAKRARVAVRLTQASGLRLTVIAHASKQDREAIFYRRDGDVLLSELEDGDLVYPYSEYPDGFDDLTSPGR